MTGRIPIFVITFQRLEVLKKVIESYKIIKTPHKIVISDNASTYRPLIAYLKQLEQEGCKVFWNKKNSPFENVAANLKSYLKNCSRKPRYYCVGDSDVMFAPGTSSNVLEVYKFLLHKYRVSSVGPMLQINSIPYSYPARAIVMQRHGKIWARRHHHTHFHGKRITFTRFPIDTSFSLYSARTPFPVTHRSKLPAIRVHPPYESLHLDWYITADNISEDQRVYASTAKKGVSHWSHGGEYYKRARKRASTAMTRLKRKANRKRVRKV